MPRTGESRARFVEGRRANGSLAEGLTCEVVTVGDAARPFNIGEAICSANAAARAL